ncbi:MAG: outer membrane beta-barrel family protein [Chitinophagaceae bacterium]
MSLKIKLFSALALTTLALYGMAQTSGKISGSIKDGGIQKTIDAASISLLRSKDSSLVKISITDKEGDFLFENVKDGDYLVMATSTGYKKTYSSNVGINGNSVSVGVLQLTQQTKTLQEVSVLGKKPFIERKIDRTIVNVDALISNTGSTAMEVLEKSPGVSVDKDGKISLRGKQGVIIMLDGKPSYLGALELANLLKNMPSSSLEQIEIMTNPSAKYDASGNSGIINIKTKKNKLVGFNGNLSLSYGQGIYSRTNNSINLNYRTGKVNLFGNYGYSNYNSGEDLGIIRNFRNVQTKQLETIFEQSSYMKNYGDNHNMKAGIDYYINKKTTVGLVFTGFTNPGGQSGDNTTYLKNGFGVIDSVLIATNKASEKSLNYGANFNLRHIFDSTGKELTADFDYIKYDQSSVQNFSNAYFNANGSTRKPGNDLRGTLPASVQIYSAKVDFTLPLKKGAKLETGIKSSYVTTDNEALYANNSGAGWMTDYGKTNHFIYKENINAAYLNGSKQIGKWGIQTGLRAEYTVANGHQLGNIQRPDSSFDREYLDLFPTVYFSYDANKKNNFSINYGRRIDRPDYQDLNPFYYFLDEYTYQVGNTLLRPQFSNGIELSHTYNGFLTTTLNYSKTNDMMAQTIDQINSERKTFVTKDNIATMKNMGLSVSANFPVAKFWNTNLYTNFNHKKYKGELNGGELDVSGSNVMVNVGNQFKLKKGWSGELSGWWRSKGIEGQIVADPMWQASAGVQKQILKSKGSLKLGIRDIFASQNFKGSVKYNDIDVLINEVQNRRRVTLTFAYRFGKPMKDQKQPRKTGGAGDESGRVKSGRG